jgi:hypothetical protein
MCSIVIGTVIIVTMSADAPDGVHEVVQAVVVLQALPEH